MHVFSYPLCYITLRIDKHQRHRDAMHESDLYRLKVGVPYLTQFQFFHLKLIWRFHQLQLADNSDHIRIRIYKGVLQFSKIQPLAYCVNVSIMFGGVLRVGYPQKRWPKKVTLLVLVHKGKGVTNTWMDCLLRWTFFAEFFSSSSQPPPQSISHSLGFIPFCFWLYQMKKLGQGRKWSTIYHYIPEASW